MKNTIITATALIAAAAAVTYFIKRKKAASQINEPAQRPAHHLTNVFAKAKSQVLDM